MFFLLSKTLLHLLLPVVWVLGLLIWAFLTQSQTRRKKLLGFSIGLFLLFSNDWLATRAYRLWEYPVIPINKVTQKYAVAVVLGGFTDLSKQPRDRVYLSQGSDRLMHALLLYRLGIVKTILASGGSGIPNFIDASEAERIRDVLKTCNVDTNDILLEPKARNTHENAVFSAAIIRKHFPGGKVLVFTSAFHCRRAHACFRKQGLDVDMFPVDFRFTDPSFNKEKAFIPSDGAWDKWGLLIHEIAGYLIYKMAGYA
ncbi:MAG TPA: YdcF family protein [Catalimonadaceae bacterium]|nr:YdcF family protein [Catalimonadaceae bacterium]HPI10073.1 YdcF family protein [Catalimonadaceae bacterium]